jgi:hypothetical protein
MRGALTPNVAKEVLAFRHREITEECRLRREAWERWHSTRHGCPWGCDGSGVVEIALCEYAPWEAIPDLLEIVLPHGLILTPCECAA